MRCSMSDEFKAIPNFSRYLISKAGVVKESKTGKIMPAAIFGNTGLAVKIKSDSWKWLLPSVARLVLTTFDPLPEEWMYTYASVVMKDSDPKNVNLSNLAWTTKTYKPPSPIVPNVGVTIPGFSQYTITPEGVVRNSYGKVLSLGYVSTQGYRMMRLISDSQKSMIVGVHRLLALTFLEHPVDTAHLVTNHKDGVKLHNSIDNLEWATYGDNITHAYTSGLRDESRGVQTVNLLTKAKRVFSSFNECARFFKVGPSSIKFQLDKSADPVEYRGYLLSKIKPSIGNSDKSS